MDKADASDKSNISTPKYTRPNLAYEDQVFLETLTRLILTNISNNDFTIPDLLPQLYISQAKLFYEVKRLLGKTPNEYILDIRYNKSLDLLLDRRYKTVKEVSYAVGVKDSKYFASQFRERFGKLPSEYL